MLNTFLDDVERTPNAFDLSRPAMESELEAVEAELGAALPPSLREILVRYGQGLFFDNESLLGVHEIDEGLGDLVSVNRDLRDKQGLPATLIVFHLGLGGLHAFDVGGSGPEYPVVALDEDSLERAHVFAGFEEWYVERMRAEYASVLDLE